jgi:hypothetical protein
MDRPARIACKCARDCLGAVYVEFLIAFLPLFFFFSALVQLGMLQIADLVTKHAAVMAARAAVVVLPDNPDSYGGVHLNEASGKRLDDIIRAASVPLTAVPGDDSFGVRVLFPTRPGATDTRTKFGPDELVRVRVEYDYRCNIPIGNRLVCGLLHATKTLVGEAARTNQGPHYSYTQG